jgi:serine/threonine protein kinase
MDKVGPYQILDVLHRGPQPLYRAKAADGKVVALKTVPAASLTPEMHERFTREGQTCRTLDHPNLVRVFDTGEADGMLYQAMELLEGADLGKVFAEGRQFTWEGKLSIMEQVCDGLQYAHEHKLVHRDIKPANLFLENSGGLRVLDFGMVRVAASELTKLGSSVGTLNYMSPEQIRGDRCTPASDVFSAGIVFYQLATGRHPFSTRDRSLAQVVSAIVFEKPPKLSEIVPDAPEGLEFILRNALEKDPAKRLQNGGDLKQALALCRITMNLGIVAPATAAPPEAAGEKTKVLPRFAGAPPAPSAQAEDAEKTRVMNRAGPAPVSVAPSPPPRPISVAHPPPPPIPAPHVPRPAPPKPVAQVRYCPSCTAQNPAAAEVCWNCRTPLASRGVDQEKPRQWGLYFAIGVAVLLALTLVVVLVTK